jgi:hypothetical protein
VRYGCELQGLLATAPGLPDGFDEPLEQAISRMLCVSE